MLAIGRALMAGRKVLLLDEPSMGLAPMLVQQIFAIIVEINQRGTTVLLVEQNAAAGAADRAPGYVMETGEIVKSAAATPAGRPAGPGGVPGRRPGLGGRLSRLARAGSPGPARLGRLARAARLGPAGLGRLAGSGPARRRPGAGCPAGAPSRDAIGTCGDPGRIRGVPCLRIRGRSLPGVSGSSQTGRCVIGRRQIALRPFGRCRGAAADR